MLLEDVTGSQLIEATRKAAADDPDKVISLCQYADKAGGPVCLIGRAFYDLGVDLRTLSSEPIAVILEGTGTATNAEITWLSVAQAKQDDKYPWAEAVAEADDAALSV